MGEKRARDCGAGDKETARKTKIDAKAKVGFRLSTCCSLEAPMVRLVNIAFWLLDTAYCKNHSSYEQHYQNF